MAGILRFLKPKSFKRQLITILTLSALIPLTLLGGVSYYSIYSLLDNRVERGIKSNLEMEMAALENTMNNLDFASKQLAFGSTGRKVQTFISSTPSMKAALLKEVNEELQSILYTNVVIGTMFYFVPDTSEYVFDYYIVDKKKDPFSFPLLSSKPKVSYYAFHRSMSIFEPNPVLSIIRQADNTEDNHPMYVYLETSPNVLRSIFRSEQYGMPVNHVLINDAGVIVYSSSPDIAQPGAEVNADKLSVEGHRTYSQDSVNGWKLVAILKENDITEDIQKWLLQFWLISMFAICASLSLAWIIWRTINKPMLKLKKEIQLVSMNQLEAEVQLMGLREFDDLLLRVGDMKQRIVELLLEVERKENRKRVLEVEKLMHQINPHFLHNTLNTIQWIAMMNQQKEIVNLVKTFSRVLHYNLGKEGGIVPLREEIQALNEYIELQQIRYHHIFQIQLHIEEEALDCMLPRFTLQPLVENALYHAFRDEGGKIQVSAAIDSENHLVIDVTDNGQGMTEEKIEALLSNEPQEKRGLGIGLPFVNHLVQAHFGPEYKLGIRSELEVGTVMTIRIPVRREDEA
jgi:two-component system sensor histidine kinase YesM